MRANYSKFLVKIIGIIRLSSASLLINLPSQAQPKQNIFNELFYNRGRKTTSEREWYSDSRLSEIQEPLPALQATVYTQVLPVFILAYFAP